jgi:predicted MFS family arabinose efflux permease
MNYVDWYNNQRLHGLLGNITPEELEQSTTLTQPAHRPATPPTRRRQRTALRATGAQVTQRVNDRRIIERPRRRGVGLPPSVGAWRNVHTLLTQRSADRLDPTPFEGLSFVFTHQHLRALTVASATAAFFNSAVLGVEVLFFARDLHLSGTGVAVMLAMSGIGSVAGAVTTGWWTSRAGQVRTIWVVPMLTWPAHIAFPLTQPGPLVILGAAGILVFSYGATIYNVLSMRLRQVLCPERLRGRVLASMRFVIRGSMPSARWPPVSWRTRSASATLWVAVAGTIAALLPILASPLRTLRTVTALADQPA